MRRWVIGIAVFVVASVIIFGWRPTRHSEPLPTTTKDTTMQEIKVTSGAFQHNGMIPLMYTCDGNPPAGGTVPPLEVGNIPSGTKTLALIMHDPDAPRAGGWTHWVKYNVPWNMEHEGWSIKEGREPEGMGGKGTGGGPTYQGPCPPSGTHRYVFTVYALDTELALKEDATKTELESAMQGHIIGIGELVGLYARK